MSSILIIFYKLVDFSALIQNPFGFGPCTPATIERVIATLLATIYFVNKFVKSQLRNSFVFTRFSIVNCPT